MRCGHIQLDVIYFYLPALIGWEMSPDSLYGGIEPVLAAGAVNPFLQWILR